MKPQKLCVKIIETTWFEVELYEDDDEYNLKKEALELVKEHEKQIYRDNVERQGEKLEYLVEFLD